MSLLTNVSKRVGLCLLLLILFSCALIPAKKEVAVEAPPSAEEKQALQRLAMAERAFQEGNLQEASERYEQLALAFPRSPQVAKALLRRGEIEFLLEHFKEAASRFQEVINQFPVRPEGDEARIWLLRCYFELELYNDAVETGRSLTNYLSESSQKAAAAEIVGDAQAAQEKYTEAVRWYVKAYDLAGEEKHTLLTEKIDAALKHLDRESVMALLAEYPDRFPNLRLQTRLVGVEMEKGHLTAAQQQLLALIEEQPQHPLAETWKEMAEKVEEWLRVDMTTVGCVLPISGRYKAYGDRMLRGLLMAAQDLQSQSVGGSEIQLIIRDSGSDPDVAVAAVRDLVTEQRVAAIIGPLSRVAAEAAAEEAENLWVPIITLTQKQGVNNIGSFVFRSFLSNEQQTRALAEYAVLQLGYRRFAMLSPNDSYGTRLVQLFWDELDRLGAEVRGVEFYDPSQTDFADQIKKLVGLYYPRLESEITDESRQAMGSQGLKRESEAAARAKSSEEEPLPIVDFEAVFIPDGYSQVGLIAPQLAYYDVTGIRMLGTNLWNSPKLVEMAAPYLQGSVFVDGFFAGSSLPLTNQFVLRYQQFFGENPGYPEALAYDTMRLLAEALRQPGVTSRPILRDALLAIRDLPGVAGTASVGPQGEVHKPPFLISVHRRRMEEVPVDFDTLRKRQQYIEFFSSGQGYSAPAKVSSGTGTGQ